ncbi:MAG: hypothetical protein IT445_11860 [Phycisphaeraceae bacterium]|nr:hypothetical protein [Phycisphaeraceae bacterium]
MAQPGTATLKSNAFAALETLGYSMRWDRLVDCRSRSVHKMAKDGKETWFLIQCRHNQPETDRYLVGIIVDALKRVDFVALFFEGETRLPIIPAEYLLKILQHHKQVGDASFTGNHSEQWRVDIHLSDEQLSPQGSCGQRYSISSYINRVPLKLS